MCIIVAAVTRGANARAGEIEIRPLAHTRSREASTARIALDQ